MINIPVLLTAEHDVGSFSCGNFNLDNWLKTRAFPNQNTGASRTYVLLDSNRVIGFYALASGGVAASEAPGRVKRNMPDPVPVMILARFAIEFKLQGKGLGADLLRDAVLRTLQAAEIGGIRALLAHAKDNRAAAFYERNGFLPSPMRSLTLFLPLN
jgi:GNAT superfamily N-acetyltransferase